MTEQHSDKFPGPRPYEEHQHHLFFGREREVERMINATRERFGVLSAESGAGKSSLLAAGYIPELRRRRAAKGGEPPVLLLRAWGGRASKPEDRILDGAREAIDQLLERSQSWAGLAHTLSESDEGRSRRANDIAKCIAEDHRKLTGVLARPEFNRQPGPPMTDVVRALCDTEGLILILDQFEEFMGSASAEAGGDRRPEEKVAHAVGRLFRDIPKVRILVSLRTEYCRRLQRYLNIFVPNLDRRIIDLSPLPPASIVQIVKGVSGKDGPEIEAFAWKLALASGATEGTADDDDESSGEYRLGLSAQGSNVSVLEVQALLYGFDAWCTKTLGDTDFTTSRWDDYVESLMDGLTPDGATPRTRSLRPRRVDLDVGRSALRDWVRGQLEMAVCNSRPDIDPLGQRARWMLMPVLPRLSTHGGYKQHLPLMQLFLDLADRLSEGYGKLDIVKKCIKTWMDNGSDGDLHIKLEAKDFRELGQAYTPSDETPGMVQGCLEDFAATIESLEVAGILKLSGRGTDISCELVHDGLSDHVRKWSDDLPRNPETTLGCPVEVVGERFAWQELVKDYGEPREIEDKKWIGCSVGSATIRNIKFKRCDFRGLALKQCVLENVSFEDCEMAGAIMIGGTWTRTVFIGCSLMSASFLQVGFGEKTEFHGYLPKLGKELEKLDEGKRQSDMTGIQFEECRMLHSSEMEFTECLLRFARIGGTKNESGNRWRFAKCDMMNAWVEDAGLPSIEVDQHCRTIGLLSFTLPPPAWLGRRPS